MTVTPTHRATLPRCPADKALGLEDGEAKRGYREVSANRSVHGISSPSADAQDCWLCYTCRGEVAPRVLQQGVSANKVDTDYEHITFFNSYFLGGDLTLSLVCGNNLLITDLGETFCNFKHLSFTPVVREIVCSSLKFNREMIGYDLRRNESVSYEYTRGYPFHVHSLATC